MAADLGSAIWQYPDHGKTAAIRLIALRYTVRCESRRVCDHRATTGIECRDKIGHPIWRKDFCEAHAKPIIEIAQARGIEVYWHGDPANESNAR